MPSQPFAVVGISQLVSMEGPEGPRTGAAMSEIGLVEDASLLVRDGQIAAFGPRSLVEIPDGYAMFDVGNRLVTPGLIDAHAHPVFVGNRATEFEMRASGKSYQEIAAAGGGIQSSVRSTREAGEEDLIADGRDHLDWMLRCGTTTAEAKSGYGLTLEDELKMLRAIRTLSNDGPIELIPTFLGAHAIPSQFAGDPSACIANIVQEILPTVAERQLAKYVDIFVEQGYFTSECARLLADEAHRWDLGLRMHVDQLSESGGAELAAELRAKTADHLEQTESDGIRALAEASVQPVLLPASVYGLGLTRYANARAMIESGLAVVLATDFNPGSSPSPSLPMAMSLACTQMKMTPAECLTATTHNAALSLDLQDRGGLTVGKRADFVVWDCRDFRELPYWFGVELSSAVFIRGELVYQRN